MRKLRQLGLAGLLGAGLLTGCGGGESSRHEQASRPFQPPPGWTTYRDDRRGYEVSFPSGWHRARRSLSTVVDPREILSVATYPLRPTPRERNGYGRCYAAIGVPAPSLDDFGPRDAIISIQERLRRRRRPGGYADRQRPLRLPPLDPHYPRGYPTSCTRPRWIAFHGFRDAGRNFYAFAAVGRAASAETRRDTRRVLESLAFEHPERGYAIDLPEGWQRAERTIVPLTDPREVVAFGTYPLRYRRTHCVAFAGSAREDLGPAAVLGVVMERGLDPGSEWSEFAPRPARLDPTDPREAEPACGDHPGTTSDWIAFSDAGRHLYALLVFGATVTEDRRAEAYRTLDSLRLDPAVRPTWRSSG